MTVAAVVRYAGEGGWYSAAEEFVSMDGRALVSLTVVKGEGGRIELTPWSRHSY